MLGNLGEAKGVMSVAGISTLGGGHNAAKSPQSSDTWSTAWLSLSLSYHTVVMLYESSYSHIPSERGRATVTAMQLSTSASLPT